jgi:hypothetical protein
MGTAGFDDRLTIRALKLPLLSNRLNLSSSTRWYSRSRSAPLIPRLFRPTKPKLPDKPEMRLSGPLAAP